MVATVRRGQPKLASSSSISGLPDRYSSKVLSLTSCRRKRIGMVSLGPLLGALGLKLIAVEDHEAVARNRSRYTVRDAAHLKSASARWNAPAGHQSRRARNRQPQLTEIGNDIA